MSFRASGSGSTAVITGGSSGIGFATAAELSRRGFAVVIIARNEGKLADACARLDRDIAGGTHRYLSLDIAQLNSSNFEAADKAMAAVTEALPPVGVLINGAGAAFPGTISDRDPALIEKTVNLNFTGLALFTRLMLPRIGSGGSVVNISSMGGLFPIFGLADYGAAKQAVILFSDALRSELKPRGIDVHVMCPPDTDTPGFENENKTKPEETAAISGKAGLWSPEKVADIMFRGLDRGKFLILPDFTAKLQVTVGRVFPWLIRMLFDSDIKSIQKKRKKHG